MWTCPLSNLPELREKMLWPLLTGPSQFHASVPLHKTSMKAGTLDDEMFLTVLYRTIPQIKRPWLKFHWVPRVLRFPWCLHSQEVRSGLQWLWENKILDEAWARYQIGLGHRARHSFIQENMCIHTTTYWDSSMCQTSFRRSTAQ